MPSFRSYFDTTSNLSTINGNITSLLLVGCVVGALSIAFYGDVLGRRKAIFLGGCLFTIGAGAFVLDESFLFMLK